MGKWESGSAETREAAVALTEAQDAAAYGSNTTPPRVQPEPASDGDGGGQKTRRGRREAEKRVSSEGAVFLLQPCFNGMRWTRWDLLAEGWFRHR